MVFSGFLYGCLFFFAMGKKLGKAENDRCRRGRAVYTAANILLRGVSLKAQLLKQNALRCYL